MPKSAYTCCLCGSEEFGYGNNPDPLGKMPACCCNTCNFTKVIPARIEGMMSSREFSSEDTQEQAAAAIVGGIFTVSMGALLEHLGTALKNEDAPAATFFKDCIDYMGMAMVSSYEENTKNFPKEVTAAIDMTLGMTAQQLRKWEEDPSFEELTNLGSSENPDVETMSEVVLEDATDFEDDFGVMYSSEDECEHDWLATAWECQNKGCDALVHEGDTEDVGECVATITGQDTDHWWKPGNFVCQDCGLKEEFEAESEPDCDHLTTDPGGRCTHCWKTPAEQMAEREGAETYCEVCEQYFPADSKWSKLTDCSSCGMAACVDCMRFGDECVACSSGYAAEAESYVDFFSQIEELLESTAKDGNWMLDATTNPKDPDSVLVEVEFTPKDPSKFFDIIE